MALKKRVLSLLIAAVICICAALPAFADMGYIHYNEIDVIVSNPDGLVMYYPVWNPEGTEFVFRSMAIFIPSKALLTVRGEYVFNGEIYTEVTYRESNGYIKLSGLIPVDDSFGVENAYKINSPRKIAVINENGVCLRKGPGNVYEEASEVIEYGTVLTYEYTNAEYESISTWAYVEHNGESGWIYIYQGGISGIYDTASVLEKTDFYTGSIEILADGAYLTKTPSPDSEKVISDISAGTKLSSKYFYSFENAVSVFVEYDGVKGWIETSNANNKVAVGVKSGAYILSADGMVLYSDPFDKNSKTEILIPEGTNLPVKESAIEFVESEDYKRVTWLHTEYNGTDGWICCRDYSECSQMYGTYDLKIIAEDGADLYAQPDIITEPVSVLEKDSVVTVIYETAQTVDNTHFRWNYVECNGSYGWLITNIDETEYVENSENQPDVPPGSEKASEEFMKRDIEEAPELVENYLPVIIAVCAATVVIAAAVIIFTVVRKKKKAST